MSEVDLESQFGVPLMPETTHRYHAQEIVEKIELIYE